MPPTVTREATIPPITTAARRIARKSDPDYRTFFDTEGTYVDAVPYSGERYPAALADLTPADWAVHTLGKVDQRYAQDLLDAYAQLVAIGFEHPDARGGDSAVRDLVHAWSRQDEIGLPRETAAEWFETNRLVALEQDAERAREDAVWKRGAADRAQVEKRELARAGRDAERDAERFGR